MDAGEVVDASRSRAVMDDPDLLDSLRSTSLSVRLQGLGINTSDAAPDKSLLTEVGDGECNTEPDTVVATPPSLPPSRPELAAKSNHAIFAVCSNGKIQAIAPDAYVVRPRDRRGVRLLPARGAQRIRQVLAYDRNLPAYILTRSGALHVLRPMITLDDEEFGTKYRAALADGAIFVQAAGGSQTEHPTIVCMDNTGGVVRVKLPTRPTAPQTPVRIVSPVPGTHLVSACICAEDEDILLVSAGGKALRLDASDLRAKKSYGVGMIQGLGLDDDDRAVVCIPYRDTARYLVTTERGMMIHLAPLALRAHGRGSRGGALAGLYDGDAVASIAQAQPAALLVTGDGYSLCVNMVDVAPLNRGARGVKGIKAVKSRLIGAVPLQIADY